MGDHPGPDISDGPAIGVAPFGVAEALARLAVGRDPLAWSALHDLVGDDILRLVTRVVGDAELARDAMQETFLHLRDRAGRFRFVHGENADAAARRWILTMAANLGLDQLRRRQLTRRHAERVRRHGRPAASLRPDEELVRAEQAELVRGELALLPELTARAIVMHHVAEMSFEDVAAALRLPVGTAKTRVRRGLLRLRERLERHGAALSLVALGACLEQMPAVEASWTPAAHSALLTSAARAKASGVAAGGIAAGAVALLLAASSLTWLAQRAPAVAAPMGLEFFVATGGDDSSEGSAQRPWATIQHAADRAGAGTTIHVAAGRYDAPVVVRTGGTSAARVRFVSDLRWGARIDARGDAVWTVDHADYVDIEGFDIASSDPTDRGARFGIFILASHCRVLGNQVHDLPALAALTDAKGGAGICCGDHPPWTPVTTTGNEISGNVVHDVGSRIPANPASGIQVNDSGAHVWNNICYRNQGAGIETFHAADRLVIANNLVSGNQAGGIRIAAGEKPVGAINDHTLVANNIVVNNSGLPGILESGSTGGSNRYLANCLSGNTVAPFRLQHGIVAEGTIVADPGFAEADPDGGAPRLLDGGALIDAGIAEGAPPTDFLGVPRPQAGGVDIGPYEVRLTQP